MKTELLNMGLAFFEGLGLIVSPCILPILPFILTGSLTGNKKRPLSIILGFVLTFALFTFFSRQLVRYTGVDLGVVRHISYGILFLFGVVMMSTYLTEKFAFYTRRLGNIGSGMTELNNPEGGVVGGMAFGGIVAIIWTPCAGPLLAAVIVQSVLQKTTISSFFIVLAFGIGVAIPMLLVAFFGRAIMQRMSFFKMHTILLRQFLGAIIILAVLYMIYDERYAMGATVSFSKNNNKQNMIIDGLLNPYPAPALVGITDWINSSPLQIDQLRGNVVLIDFWTYSCINCIRTLPYLRSWYEQYHNKGLVIIGVHTPEFDFEKNINNVKSAVIKENILYPVALDNQFSTWMSYQNRYWPAHYLIDKNGYVVYRHFGEGEYDVTESNIRYLLGLNTKAVSSTSVEVVSMNQTPETYLGFARAEHFMSPESMVANHSAYYTFPKELAKNSWALQGNWVISSDKVTSSKTGAAIKIHFNAGNVYIVMGSANGFTLSAKLLLNGEDVISAKGKDVVNSMVSVNQHTLYHIIEFNASSDGILQVTALTPGLEIYTFTFGK
jgi:cytochrome c biogenesis protein CcdA/thiol-disulfide isomerase/thioredoxin